MGLSFYRHFAGAQADKLDQALVVALVKWDPKGASAADLAARDEQLNQIGLKLVTIRRKFDQESAQLAPKIELNNQHLHAAEDLDSQARALPEGSAERTKKERSLAMLLDIIEVEQPEIDQAKADMADTRTYLSEVEAAHKEAVASLTTARANLAKAQRELERAGTRREREREKADMASVVAGLRPDHSKLNVALNAMHTAAEKANTEADAARLKRESLAPMHAVAEEDPEITAAMARASGVSQAPKSASERLAALKAKSAS